jgi:hypothetical protein
LLLGASSPEKQVAAGRDCALAVRKYKLPCLWLAAGLLSLPSGHFKATLSNAMQYIALGTTTFWLAAFCINQVAEEYITSFCNNI